MVVSNKYNKINPYLSMKFQRSLFLLSLFTATLAYADDVPVETARTIAMERLGASDVHLVNPSPMPTRAVSPSQPYYIFNDADGSGYVIVSGDDSMPSVFGYSDSGSINISNMPGGLVNMLRMYSECVETAKTKGGLEAEEDAKPSLFSSHPESVSPLLTTMWGQGKPYNQYCPEGTVVGCVATAAVQVMKYYAWPSKGKGMVTTLYNGSNLTVDLNNSTYAWDQMKDNLYDNLDSPEASDAVARISYDFGVAAKLNYGQETGGSNACALRALYTYFSYDGTDMQFLFRDWFSTEEWMDMLKSELAAGHPVLYDGSSYLPDGSQTGHAFVLDGYDEIGYVHVNWGWDGYADGYYDIALLNPDHYTFNLTQEMIIGVRPGKDLTTVSEPNYRLVTSTPLKTKEDKVNYGVTGSSIFTIMNPEVINRMDYNYNGEGSIALFDAAGHLIKQDIRNAKSFKFTISLPMNYYYAGESKEISCSLPSKLADGEYILRFVTYDSRTEKWTIPYTIGGSMNNYIRVVLADKKAKFDYEPTTAIDRIPMADNTDDTTYDLSGKVVPANTNGIVIRNGRKYLQRSK